MSNANFKYKKFTIQQDQCAMKVCTDASLFGAWTAEIVGSKESAVGSRQSLDDRIGNAVNGKILTVNTILDIGSGTGLLALMLAQKTDALIDTIEIDTNAYQQATENCAASPWSDRIQVIHADVKKHHFTMKYDLIISNPPFFEQQLRSPVSVTNTARHETALKWEELIAIADQDLHETGLFAVLLPYQRSGHFTTLASLGNLHPLSALYVKQSPQHLFFRSMLLFRRQPCLEIKREELIIKVDGQYSPRFIALLKDYYLYL